MRRLAAIDQGTVGPAPRELPFGLDAGVYLQAEAALLTGLPRTTVRRWLHLERGVEAIPVLAGQPLVSFHDLISLRAVAALRAAGMKLQKIKQGVGLMRRDLGLQHPLATEDFKTSGVDRYFPSASEQMAAQELVAEYLQDVKYGLLTDQHRLAVSWDPPGVSIDPLIQRGAPCIAGTRVQVAVLKRYLDAGDSAEYLAALFELEADDIRRAVAWYIGPKLAA